MKASLSIQVITYALPIVFIVEPRMVSNFEQSNLIVTHLFGVCP